jgi:hypothetical protein
VEIIPFLNASALIRAATLGIWTTLRRTEQIRTETLSSLSPGSFVYSLANTKALIAAKKLPGAHL